MSKTKVGQDFFRTLYTTSLWRDCTYELFVNVFTRVVIQKNKIMTFLKLNNIIII